jgi:hypothetical protein
MSKHLKLIYKYRDFVKQINDRFKSLTVKSGVGKHISIVIGYECEHILERMQQRDVPLAFLGTATKRLMEYHYCELLFHFTNYESKYESGDVNSSTFYVCAVYKDNLFVFMAKNTNNFFKLSPKTVLTKDMIPRVDSIFNLDKR